MGEPRQDVIAVRFIAERQVGDAHSGAPHGDAMARAAGGREAQVDLTQAVNGHGCGDEQGYVAGNAGYGILDAVDELNEGRHGAEGDDTGFEAEYAPPECGEVAYDEPAPDQGTAHGGEAGLLAVGRVELTLYGAEALVHLIDTLEGPEHHAMLKALLYGDLHVAFAPAYLGGEPPVSPEIKLAGHQAHRHDDDGGQREVGIEPGEKDK